jgi:hypothetical protein
MSDMKRHHAVAHSLMWAHLRSIVKTRQISTDVKHTGKCGIGAAL